MGVNLQSSSDGANRDTRQCEIIGSWVAGDFRPSSVANGGLTELILVASKEDSVTGKISFLPSTSPPLVTTGPWSALTATSMRASKLLIAINL